MRGQLRDAKIAYAIENHPKHPRPNKSKPWQGFFAFFRSLLGEQEPPPPKRRVGRLRARRAGRERRVLHDTQQQHEAWCDKRFREMQLRAVAMVGDIHPRHHRPR